MVKKHSLQFVNQVQKDGYDVGSFLFFFLSFGWSVCVRVCVCVCV